MADVILSPLVDAIIGNLVFGATDEIKILWGIEEEVNRLHRTLSTIQEVLEDAEEKQVTSNGVKNWLCELKEVVYDADDIVDEFITEAPVRAKLEGLIPETSKRRQVSKFFSPLRFNKNVIKDEIGYKIKEVGQRLEDIQKECSQFHLKSSYGGRPSQPIERHKTGSLIDESEVIGRDDDKEKLIQILMTNDDIEKKISVIPIVGMGGSGKTTLAQLLYNDMRIDSGFEKKAWVCVSNSFDAARVTKEIIESTTKAQCESLSIEQLQHKVLDILRQKKFIIVLDDVWNEDTIQWKNLCLPFNEGARGSKIIVTTRSDKVAQMMGTVSAHKLGVLSENDSWRLFEKMAVGGESSKAPQTLVNIGKKILRKCGGLPLSIKTMGALLSSNRNESRWKHILLSKIWELPEGTNDILPALRLSYQHLSTNLKQCFTYCSLFPKDHMFDRDELVQLWIGEGYVMPRAGIDMEEVGQDWFENLLSRSFFQPFKDLLMIRSFQQFDNREYFKMHDLVHDMAEFFSNEDCVKIEGGKSFDILKKTRRASLMNRGGINAIKLDDWNKFKNLRTFLNVTLDDELLEHSDVLLDLLLRCKRLRVLSLPEFSIHELPNLMGNLQHLRYLCLSSNGIKTLPKSIGALYNLHTLNLSYCEDLEELPESIGGLYNLQTLKLKGCENLTKLPRSITILIYLRHLQVDWSMQLPFGIGKLGKLVTLPYFKVGIRENECKLGELKDLVNLRGTIEISGLYNVSKKKEAEEANLKNKEYLQEVRLDWEWDNEGNSSLNDEEVLESLQPPVNIRKLEIGSYSGDMLTPSWLSKFDQIITFVNLVEVKLNRCSKCKSLPPLGQLPSLKILCLWGMKEIRILGDEFYGDNGTFPSLEYLCLLGLSSLEKWSGGMEGGGEYMPCLRQLRIENCSKLKQLPDKRFPLLESLWLWGLASLEKWSGGGEYMPCLRRLKIENCPELKQLPGKGFPSLEYLYLRNLTSLAKWSGGLEGGGEYMPCLREVTIRDCPQLKQLPDKGLPTSLQSLDILRCPILYERCKKKTGEDWPKISHIPQLKISE